MKAYELVKSASNEIKFEICFDNEWTDELTREEALRFVQEADGKDGFEHTIAYWNTSIVDEKLVYFTI